MSFLSTRNRILALALGAALLAGAAQTATAADDREADHQALRNIRAAYENALNQDKIELLMPHLASKLDATMATGEKVTSPKQFASFWTKTKRILGIGAGLKGKYHVEIIPAATEFQGDTGISHGTTKEQIVLSDGRSFDYSSNWKAFSKKEKGTWKLVGGNFELDPEKKTFSAAQRAQIESLVHAFDLGRMEEKKETVQTR